MSRLWAGAALVFLLIVSAVACSGGGSSPPGSDVAGAAPWKAPESLRYTVTNEKGDVLGSIELTIANEGSGLRLGQSFKGTQNNTDVIAVVVNPADLKPVSSTRQIVQPNGETENIEVSYTDAAASIKSGDKQTGLSVPVHSYDNDTSLFLWRTLPFADGYEASYITVITNQRSRHKVELRVVGKETVTVPAGRFDAWRLEIKTSNAKQSAWYADTPARTLIKYDNDRGVIFQLETKP